MAYGLTSVPWRALFPPLQLSAFLACPLPRRTQPTAFGALPPRGRHGRDAERPRGTGRADNCAQGVQSRPRGHSHDHRSYPQPLGAQLAAQPPLAGAAVCTGDRGQRADVRRLPRTAAAHARGLLRTQQLHAERAGAGGRAQGVQRASQPRVPSVVAEVALRRRRCGRRLQHAHARR